MSIINKISDRLKLARKKNAKDIRLSVDEVESIILFVTNTMETNTELSAKVIKLQEELLSKPNQQPQQNQHSFDNITLEGDGGTW